MANHPPDDDRREEGCSLFEWPLTDDGLSMSAGELLDELMDTISELNRDPRWDRTLLFPGFGDVIVDRERRSIVARCMWKIKAHVRKEQE